MCNFAVMDMDGENIVNISRGIVKILLQVHVFDVTLNIYIKSGSNTSMFYYSVYQFYRTCRIFSRLFTLNTPRYFLDFVFVNRHLNNKTPSLIYSLCAKHTYQK